MKTSRWHPVFWLLLAGLLLISCSRGTDQHATETRIAANIFGTLTAAVPIATLPPPPTLTPQITLTLTPWLTPTPLPQAVVHSAGLNLRDGPGMEYAVMEILVKNDLLVVTGQYQQCAWLKVIAPDGLKGWVKGDPTYVVLTGECSQIPHGTFRPMNGMVVFDIRSVTGTGRLKVSLQGMGDAVVMLVNMSQDPLVAIYVRTTQSTTIEGIADGTYQLYYLVGQDWDGDDLSFLQDLIRLRLVDLLVFSDTRRENEVSLPLFGPADGVEEIPPDAFPSLR